MHIDVDDDQGSINWLGLVVEDFRSHPEGILGQGFWALLVYRFGHARFRYQSKLIRVPWGGVHLVLHKMVEVLCGISIGVCAEIGRRVVIWHFGGVVINGGARIGNDCVLRHGVTIGNSRSDRPTECPRIGNNVNIGAGAKILGGITIGDGATIGANAVVIRDVPAGCLAVGVPATIKRPSGMDVRALG